MAKKRQVQNNGVRDIAQIGNLTFNEVSGGQKQVDIGPHLIAIPNGFAGTTDASAGIALPAIGTSIAIYNNSATMGAVAFGQTAIALAPIAGIVAADNTVGIPCAPNTWTYLSAGDAQFVRTATSTLLTFIIDDVTTLVK